MSFRSVIGGFCLFVGAYLLTINSVILYDGAAERAHSPHLKLAFGGAAVAFPWIIAVLSAMFAPSMVPTFFGLRRPSAMTFVVVGAWALFVAYNLLIATGGIAQQREETVVEKRKAGDDARTLERRRTDRLAELGKLPQHRPAAAVAAEIAAAKFTGAYRNSKDCTDTSTKDRRDSCNAVAKLESELVTAKRAAALQADVDQLDAQITAAPSTVKADAASQSLLLVEVAGMSERRARLIEAAATPVAIEVGVALMWGVAFWLFGWKLDRPAIAQSAPPAAAGPQVLLPPSEVMKSAPVASLEALTAQRKLAEWFFAHCLRPVASGALSEEEWFDHYAAVCRKSGDAPLPLDTFRRVASRYVPKIQAIDGVTRYYEVLPVVPENAS